MLDSHFYAIKQLFFNKKLYIFAIKITRERDRIRKGKEREAWKRIRTCEVERKAGEGLRIQGRREKLRRRYK